VSAFDCLVLRMRGLLWIAVSYPVLVNQHAATVEDVVGGIDRDKTGVGQNTKFASVRGDLCRISRVRVLCNHFSFIAESLP
jgi:hypothetical protein